MSIFESCKASQFEESVIRGMTRLCRQHNGVNLSQGFPDFPAPAIIKEAAKKAIDADINQYAITWGTENLRWRSAASWSTSTAGTWIRKAKSPSPAAPPKA